MYSCSDKACCTYPLLSHRSESLTGPTASNDAFDYNVTCLQLPPACPARTGPLAEPPQTPRRQHAHCPFVFRPIPTSISSKRCRQQADLANQDLYEALLIHQQICRRTTSPTLQLGRVMDELVKRWTILTKFRQLIERDTATISTFIQTYFVIPKVKHIDSTEIYHFFRGGSGGPGPRDISVEEAGGGALGKDPPGENSLKPQPNQETETELQPLCHADDHSFQFNP